MTEFEYPGLADKIADALSFQRHAEGLPPSRVPLNVHELQYIHSCISFYVSAQMLKKADEAVAVMNLPDDSVFYVLRQYFEVDLEQAKNVAHDLRFEIKASRADGLPPIPDTLPCETE